MARMYKRRCLHRCPFCGERLTLVGKSTSLLGLTTVWAYECSHCHTTVEHREER
ncbi:MAG: hypothetical protein ACXQT3_02895 [Methermicoccaceae archaeon]